MTPSGHAAPCGLAPDRLHEDRNSATSAIMHRVRATTDLRTIAAFVRRGINALFNGE
jgi:hypothetical protein